MKKNILFVISLFGFAFLEAENKDYDKKKSTFGEVDQGVDFSKVSDNLNFKKFLKSFPKGGYLKGVGNNYIGYATRDNLYIFDVVSNKVMSLSLGKMNRTDKIQCFSFDSKYIYVKFRKYIRVFDVHGNEVTVYNFGTKEVYGRDFFVDENYLYLVTHNKEIYGFRLGEKMKDIKLIFYTNDFYSTRSGNFNLAIGDDIYILTNRRFSVVHKKSGKTLKNISLDSSFDNLLLLDKNVFLYSKNRFTLINLSDYLVTYNNQINLFGKPLIIDKTDISFGNKKYSADYVYTFFFKNAFFRYSQNTYDSHCFLIKKGKVFDFILQDFAISSIIPLATSIVLIDVKNKKIKLI